MPLDRAARRLETLSRHVAPQLPAGPADLAPSDASAQLLLSAAGLAGAAVAYKKLHLGRDIPFLLKVVKLELGARSYIKGNMTTADFFEARADAFANKDAVVFGDRYVSYAELDAMANRVANWAQSSGIRRGDVVALIMENRPEYLAVWLGMAKFGAVTALINTNLREKSLVHCVRISKAKHVLVGTELGEVVETLHGAFGTEVSYWMSGPGDKHAGCTDADPLIAAASSKRPPREVRKELGPSDHLFYIYTSGTTGLPKAAVIKHLRFFLMGQGPMSLCGVTSRDRIYCCLPLYHSAGGALGIGMAWGAGATTVLRKRFSATHFFEDCRKYRCTIVQYIGELCRYLLATPARAVDTDHCVEKAVGNGLRPDIWEAFQKRFNIGKICEFFASTEGNAALFNPGERACSVGFIPVFASALSPMQLVKFDVENEEPVRDKNGFCIVCDAGEPGELLAKIEDRPTGKFDGYLGNKAGTEKKILHDVFKKGDQYFRTGDLLKRDSEGFYYFVDRIGDTFRWKGENCATGEIADVLTAFKGLHDVNVYGVAVPGHDGRAGMACMVMDDDVDLKALFEHVGKQLPAYAQPLFLRKTKAMEVTGTFKHRKVDLVKEGFENSPEPVFFKSTETGAYVELTPELVASIKAGTVRV